MILETKIKVNPVCMKLSPNINNSLIFPLAIKSYVGLEVGLWSNLFYDTCSRKWSKTTHGLSCARVIGFT